MKKFVFTHETYQKIKEKEYERLKLDMKNVDKEIDVATSALSALNAQFETERAAFAKTCKGGVGAGELLSYQGYFEFLQEVQDEAKAKLDALHTRKRELRDALARVHNELKVLEEMRQEQYLLYCKEVAAEEAKELDSHMAFTMIERAV